MTMRRMIALLAMTLATPLLLAQQAKDVHVVPLGPGRTVDLRSITPDAPVTSTADEPKEVVTWDTGIPYTYDATGNVRQIGNDKFAYDHVQRLIQATVNGVQRNYEYDLYGNRKKCRQDVGTSMEGDCQSYSVDSGSNRIIGATYDPNGSGNITALGTHAYTYDAFNMLVRDQAGDAREFVYTANDQRIGTLAAGSRTWRWTLRSEGNKVLREFTSDGGANGTASFQWAKDFVWRDGSLLATLQPEGPATTTYHYHLDHLGTPRRITNTNDNLVGFRDYFAFGPEKEGKQEPSFTSIRYTGHERDVANDRLGTLDYMHARYYNPELGRFLSLDPVSGDPRSPQSWNRYAYVGNHPLNATDPTGTCEQKDGMPPCYKGVITVTAKNPTDSEHFLFLQYETKELDEPFRGDWSLAHLFPRALWMSYKEKQEEKLVGHPVTPGAGILMIGMALVGRAPLGQPVMVRAGTGTIGPMRIVRTLPPGSAGGAVDEAKLLTLRTNNEHAVVRLSTGERALVSGGPGGISFAPGQVNRIIFHTHPYGAGSVGPSADDIVAIRTLGQTRSYVIDNGVVYLIRP